MTWRKEVGDHDRRQARRDRVNDLAQQEWAKLYDPETGEVPRPQRHNKPAPGGNQDLPEFQAMVVPGDAENVLETLAIFDGLRTNGYRLSATEHVVILSDKSFTALERAGLMVLALEGLGCYKVA